MITDSGERTEFATGALRDMHTGKGRFDLLPWNAIWEVAKHCENGALKYGERNVDKGIPVHSLIDSAIRHTVKFWLGWEDEPHLTAACEDYGKLMLDDAKDDKEMWYSKDKLDEELKRYVGNLFVPYDERYKIK